MTDLDQVLKHLRTALILTVAGSALSLTACGKGPGDQTAGQKMDSVIAKTEQAGADAKAKTESAAAKVGAAVDDAAITASVSTKLAKDPDLSATKIDVDTAGGVVSLSGPAPNAAAKARAEEIAKSVNGVASVHNNLEVKSM
ncbi:Predicted periplasmic or secreted lipoprotein [Variovorax sp. HW608]|uniref:BON domain-containing protein n=1 Tax=Variovorax sp. HW608 TaxID=1034889 RepID=UPI00081FDDF6|nr:BON domain-containing protein [Variovorax sp. HW608]SCK45455.1 Predicted periplasmic or secreted lipoprotein [Variovorax sp. HW608]